LSLLNPGGFRRGLEALMRFVLCVHPGNASALLDACIGGSRLRRHAERLASRVLVETLQTVEVRDFLRSVREEDCVEEALPQVHAPCLLLWGEEDRLLSADIPHLVASHVPSAEVYRVARRSHLLPLESPALVAGALLQFWRRSPVRHPDLFAVGPGRDGSRRSEPAAGGPAVSIRP
jgi:pimeloyl-ACP methyl ester carboxylesterase